RAKIGEMRAWVGMARAASGADLVLIKELLDRKGVIHAILPWSQDEFRRTSHQPFEPVSQPPVWGHMFDDVIGQAASVREFGQFYKPGSGQSWELVAEVTAGLAVYTARALRLDVQPLALWDGQPGRGPGGTASFVKLWDKQLRHEAIVVEMPKPIVD